jgi:hypothetical protein
MKRAKEVWVDIDHATKDQMERAFGQERAQIAAHLTQMQIDAEHWNRMHPESEPISIVYDFTDDVAEGLIARTMEAQRKRKAGTVAVFRKAER